MAELSEAQRRKNKADADKASAATQAALDAEKAREIPEPLGDIAAKPKVKPPVDFYAGKTDAEVQATGGVGAAAEIRRRKAASDAQKAAILAEKDKK